MENIESGVTFCVFTSSGTPDWIIFPIKSHLSLNQNSKNIDHCQNSRACCQCSSFIFFSVLFSHSSHIFSNWSSIAFFALHAVRINRFTLLCFQNYGSLVRFIIGSSKRRSKLATCITLNLAGLCAEINFNVDITIEREGLSRCKGSTRSNLSMNSAKLIVKVKWSIMGD